MKYWPLTFVLLAFWIGRETGAQEKPTSSKHDVLTARLLKVERIEVWDKAAPAKRTRIGCGEIWLDSATKQRTHVGGSGIQVAVGDLVVGSLTSDEKSKSATVNVSALGSGRRGTLTPEAIFGGGVKGETSVHIEWGKRRSAFVLLDGKYTERVTMEYAEGRGPLVVISDRNEKPRAVLGILSTTNAATGETTLYPESTMTLLDAKGEFLEQLPK